VRFSSLRSQKAADSLRSVFFFYAAVMAIYHARLQRISRASGASAIGAASYRLGNRMHDERTDKTYNYERKRGVEASGTMLPKDAPDWDAERLWNEAEKSEKRKDATVAKEFEVAIPRELNEQQRKELVENFVRDEVNSRGLAASYGIHCTQANDGGENPHAHILITTRHLGEDGFDKKKDQFIAPTSGAKKGGKYVCDDALETFRERWEYHTNEALTAAGSSERIDCRSYEDQGIDKKPGVHMGKDAWNLEQKGVRTDLGNYNRNIAYENRLQQFTTNSDDGSGTASYPSSAAFTENQTEWNMATGGNKKKRPVRDAGTLQDFRDMNRSSKAETVLSTAAITDGYTNKDYYERMEKNREKAVETRELENKARVERNEKTGNFSKENTTPQTDRSFQDAVERSRAESKDRTPELS
jgi:hypothetical protein